ncbi:MAG: acylphosphatase [Opitutaceae bacterium]|jgi:acylphosphatase|nr:acylphosphatase [Opitutaceae bacterium]
MTTPDNTTYHETVHFAGHVQGVGFRYTTMQVAREYEVTGYVTNLLDGRVQLEVEGAEREVKAFITALGERMHGYIRKTDRHPARRAPEFSSFVIR